MMYDGKHFAKVEIIVSSGGLSTSVIDFSDCRLTVNDNYLIISTYCKIETVGDPPEEIHQVFKLSEVIKFKTTVHNITSIKKATK